MSADTPTMMSMHDKPAAAVDTAAWPAAIRQEFEREAETPNGCVGHHLLSETDKQRIWMIRLQPGERIGFHRHVLNYFWTAVTGGHGRQHVMDGSTVEYAYQPGETRHESYGAGEYKVHDLENIGDREMVFMTVETKQGANPPLPLPAELGRRAA